jgi:hypothetical protein
LLADHARDLAIGIVTERAHGLARVFFYVLIEPRCALFGRTSNAATDALPKRTVRRIDLTYRRLLAFGAMLGATTRGRTASARAHVIPSRGRE